MPLIGFHASHEQVDPRELLGAVLLAEQAGFAAAMCSDHFAPWSTMQGQSGHAWVWLGAGLCATSLPFGVVTAPGQRYHPAIIAQAAATLAQMFPGRFWMALGSGEAMNEHITGDRWLPKPAREARLDECVSVMRALLDGGEVSHDGLIRVDRARLWTRPETPPPMLAAAVSEPTARRVGAWADGLITVAQPHDALRRVIDAFREGGGAGKPVYLQVHLSYARDDDQARQIAHSQWRTNILDPALLWELDLPEQFDAAARHVRPADMPETLLASSDLPRFTDWLAGFAALGFDGLFLHHVGVDQRDFIDAFGSHVLPALERSG